MGGRIASIAVLVVFGIMLADALKNPRGVKALGDSGIGIIKGTSNALLGYKQ